MIYVLLGIAIVVATLGDILLKKSDGFRQKGFGFMAVLVYFFTFFLLSIVVQSLPVSITYATWSGVGVILTAFVGVLLFSERLNSKSIVSLGVIIAGVVLLNV